MQKQLYPIDQVEHSLEQHLARHSSRSKVIYTVIILLLLAGVALLPIVKVGVSVQSAGIIRPVLEKQEVRVRTAGFVEEVPARKNQRVAAGDVLLRVRASHVREQEAVLTAQLEQVRHFVHDLELLTAARSPVALGPGRFRSAKYRQAHAQLADELRGIDSRQAKAELELERARNLHARRLAPQAELDDREFQLAQIRAERSVLLERYQSEWQSTLTSARLDLQKLGSEAEHLTEERDLYTVRAPVDGSIEELTSISPGSYVQGGEQLAVISPDSGLVAEVYITPRDVGLLRVGMPARILVDAFNYNDWGFASGRIDEISSDFVVLDQQPVFRARVVLDQKQLKLRNGFPGELRKGMTLRARFIVAERTLFQLLRDDINDWLNPVFAER